MTQTPSPSPRKRIERLESQSAQHAALLRKLGSRPDENNNARDERLAITVSGQSGSYPDKTGSGVPKFPIKFIDATFTQSIGREVLTTQTRGNPADEYDTIAASITGEWIPPGTIVKALWQRSPVGISTEDGGEWFVEPWQGVDDLVLLSPVLCFHSYPKTPTRMYLWEIVGCSWQKTSTVVAAVDENDTNFLLVGETQWAKERIDCTETIEGEEYPLYELVGSRGLYRRATTNAQIECGAMGSAIVEEVDTCTSQNATNCQIDVCNSWGHRRCIPSGEEINAKYLKRGIWDAVYNAPNSLYLAALSAPMCPWETGSHPITGVTPLQVCEANASNLTTAENKFGLAGVGGSWLLIVRDRATCDGKAYIFQVLHVCRDLAVTGDECGYNKFIYQDCDKIYGKIQRKSAIMTCESSIDEQIQIDLMTYDALYSSVLGQSGCSLTVSNQYIRFYGFESCSAPPAGSTSIVTFSIAKATVSTSIEQCDQDGVDPVFRQNQEYFLQLPNCGGSAGFVDLSLIGQKTIDSCLRVACDANGDFSLEAHFKTLWGFCSEENGWEACINVVPCPGEETCVPGMPPPPSQPEGEPPMEFLPPPPGNVL